jgi:hypothetical protein
VEPLDEALWAKIEDIYLFAQARGERFGDVEPLDAVLGFETRDLRFVARSAELRARTRCLTFCDLELFDAVLRSKTEDAELLAQARVERYDDVEPPDAVLRSKTRDVETFDAVVSSKARDG